MEKEGAPEKGEQLTRIYAILKGKSWLQAWQENPAFPPHPDPLPQGGEEIK